MRAINCPLASALETSEIVATLDQWSQNLKRGGMLAPGLCQLVGGNGDDGWLGEYPDARMSTQTRVPAVLERLGVVQTGPGTASGAGACECVQTDGGQTAQATCKSASPQKPNLRVMDLRSRGVVQHPEPYGVEGGQYPPGGAILEGDRGVCRDGLPWARAFERRKSEAGRRGLKSNLEHAAANPAKLTQALTII